MPGGTFVRAEDSSFEGGIAAAGRGNRGIERDDQRIRATLERDADQRGDMKRVTESRRDNLRERRAEGASRIGKHGSEICLGGACIDEMTELMLDRAVLRNQEQQQQAE